MPFVNPVASRLEVFRKLQDLIQGQPVGSVVRAARIRFLFEFRQRRESNVALRARLRKGSSAVKL